MSTPLLEAREVTKFFGFPALLKVDIQVTPGQRFGLIGPNGSGKTTLVNIVTGVLASNSGRVFYQGKDITATPAYQRARLGIARTFQIPKPFISMNLVDNVCVPMRFVRGIKHTDAYQKEEAAKILHLIGLEAKTRQKPGDLNQIEMRKLELARALALRPKLLLLDEVMAGLSSSEVDELLAVLMDLNAQGIAVLMIEHIMRAVMNYCERIAVLNAGEKIAEGTPEEILNNHEVERAYLGE